MTRHITTVLFILIVSGLSAQTNDKLMFVGNVISDTVTIESHDSRTALKSILKSTNKIEIRFMQSPTFNPINNSARSYNTNFTILSYSNDWSATYFYCKSGTDTLISKDVTLRMNIDTVFAKLVSNNIFSLPAMKSLETERLEYNPETNKFVGSGMGIGDGICYCIEFKIGDRCRRYDFCDPNEYSEFYPYVYELKDYASILQIFKNLTRE